MIRKLIADNLIKWLRDFSAPPTIVSIFPTDLCNLGCLSCWRRGKPLSSGEAIPDERWIRLVDEAKEMGVSCIELIGGGEPLVRPVTRTLIEKIKELGMIGWMTSNGTLFTPELVAKMVDLGWDKLTISLDGPDSELNDFLRPPKGTFNAIMQTLTLFQEYKRKICTSKPVISFNVVISKHNAGRLCAFIDLANKFGVCSITFEPIKMYNEFCKDLMLDFENEYISLEEEFIKVSKRAREEGIFTNIDWMLKFPELIKFSGKLIGKIPLNRGETKRGFLQNVPCYEPWFNIRFLAYGQTFSCCSTPIEGENFNGQSLRDIWFGEKLTAFRNHIINGKFLPSCSSCNANAIAFSKQIDEILQDKLFMLRTRKRYHILLTDTAPLYPPLWGGPKRIWNLYGNFLSDRFDITYVGVGLCIKRSQRYQITAIRDNFKEILCANPWYYYLCHGLEKVLYKNTSLDLFSYLWMHRVREFTDAINSQYADVLICSHPWASRGIHKKVGQFFIYDAHNCEYLLAEQILKEKKLNKFVLKRIKDIEADACQKSDLILACSENEKKDLLRIYKVDLKKILIVTNGANVTAQKSVPEKEEAKKKLGFSSGDKIVIFIGAYYKPNNDATNFIVNKLALQLPDFKLLVVGTVAEAFKDRKVFPNVRFLGGVPDEILQDALSAADIAINPVSEGSGINIKMLDYMSYGLPIVTTPCGARGIDTTPRQPFIVSELDEFSDYIRRIMLHPALYQQMSQDAREVVAQRYDWQKISRKLQDAILEKM